jgi:hypothetical protein
MKLLLVLNGESYRSGNQMSRYRGTKNYIERQFLACKSHVKLINVIKDKYNIDTDLIIHSYKLNETDDNNLINYYKNHNINIISVTFLPSICENEKKFLNLTYDKINEHLFRYDGCLLIRIDLYLKEFYIQNFVFDDKIRFPHIDLNHTINITKKFPVCHVFIYYPKKYFHVIENKIVYNSTHEIYENLITQNIHNSEIDFCINTIHLCTTDCQSNPLYCQIGRKYVANYYFNENTFYLYDKELNQLVFNKELTYKKWEEYSNHGEDVLLSTICN